MTAARCYIAAAQFARRIEHVLAALTRAARWVRIELDTRSLGAAVDEATTARSGPRSLQ